jgi:single stranded DNA-binding protein
MAGADVVADAAAMVAERYRQQLIGVLTPVVETQRRQLQHMATGILAPAAECPNAVSATTTPKELLGVVSGRGSSSPSFFTVIVWRDQAEHAAQSLSKGSRVVVVGRLQQRTWTAEDGSARSVVEVVAEELGPSLRWATTTRATRSQNQ